MNIITSALYSKAHVQENSDDIRLFINGIFSLSAYSLVAVKSIIPTENININNINLCCFKKI